MLDKKKCLIPIDKSTRSILRSICRNEDRTYNSIISEWMYDYLGRK